MADSAPKKVYVNVLSRRSPEWGSIICLNKAMQFASKHGITTSLIPRVGESLVCRARQNTIVDYLEKDDYDYLFTVDDDIEIPIDTIVKLVNSGKDIIGGFYRLKQKDEAHIAVRPLKNNLLKLEDIFKKEIIAPVKYLSTGCMLISSRLIDDLIKHYPELEYNQNMTNKIAYALYMPFIHVHENGFREYLSEDWALCQRAINIGYEIWADGSIRCGHWGLIKYDFGE